MFRCALMKYLGVAVLALAISTLGVRPVEANFVEDLAKELLKCQLTGTCVRENTTKNGGGGRNNGNRGVRRPNAAQIQQNMDVQNALNAFQFPVGTADGVLGRRSRAAISNYQYYMNWPATGTLDSFQRETLVNTWNKLKYGAGSAYPNMMAREGSKGLLRTALNPNYPQQFGDLGSTVPRNDPIPRDTGGGGQVIVEDEDDSIIIPDLPTEEIVAVSIAQHCELVQITTEAVGGVTSANMTDPGQALNEKFCGARDFAMRNGDYVRPQVTVDDATLQKICGKIAKDMTAPMQRLATDGPGNVLGEAASVNGKLGLLDAKKAMVYGQACLGMGYRQDNAEIALASAMVLSAAGQSPFAELIGHHLREGLGVSANSAASKPWYERAVMALEGGETPVFDPSSTRERIMVIRKAIEMGGLSAGLATMPEFTPTVNAIALPRN